MIAGLLIPLAVGSSHAQDRRSAAARFHISVIVFRYCSRQQRFPTRCSR